MTEILKFIFNAALGILGEQLFSWLCESLKIKNLRWHIRVLFVNFIKKLPISIICGVAMYVFWLYYRATVIDYALRNFIKLNINVITLVSIIQCFFYIIIVHNVLVLKEYIKERGKLKKLFTTYKQISEGNQLKNAITDLAEKVVVSECVLSGLINLIPGMVIAVDHTFNIALCNEDYRKFCQNNFRVAGLGKSVFYYFQDFLPPLRLQDGVFNTFKNSSITEGVLLYYKAVEFNVSFYPVRNGSVLMVIVVFKKNENA